MATCGRCQREIIWAWFEEAGSTSLIPVDKLTAFDKKTFNLDYSQGPDKPVATRVRRPDAYPGHRLHLDTCGEGTLG